MKKIKVFISGVGSTQETADKLTNDVNDWLRENPAVDIISVHTNSNKYAWSLTILYSI